jgi:hypothetical protein
MAGFMPIGDFTVTYTNGETVLATSNFLGLVEIERRWPGQSEVPAATALGVAVWFYLGCPGGELDEWLATVHLIERTEDSADDAVPVAEVPTPPAVGVA